MTPIVRNLAALLSSQVATWGATIIWTIFVPRILGDAQLGRWGFAYAFTALFSLVAGMGTAPFITMETARDPSRLGFWVFNTMLMKVPIVVIASLAAILLVHVLGYPPETCLLVASMCVGMSLYVLNQTMIAGLQGEQRMGRTAAWYVIQRYAEVAGTVVVLFTRKSLILMALCSSGAEFLSSIGNGPLVWSRVRAAARVDLRLWKRIALGGLPFMVWDIVGTIYATIDVSMLSYMVGDSVVGWYAVAYKLVGIPVFLPYMVMRAFFPELSSQGAKTSATFSTLANRAVRVVVFCCIPMAAGIALVAADLIAVFHYPVAFMHSIPLIRILASQIPVLGFDMVMAAAIIANGRQKQWVVVGCLAAVLNPSLNLIAIPVTTHLFGNGAIGASIITVATEAFMLCGAFILRPQGVLDRATVGYLIRCILSCLPMFPAVVAVGESGLPVAASLLAKIVAGAAVYGLASLSLRTISSQQILRAGVRLLQSSPLRSLAGAE